MQQQVHPLPGPWDTVACWLLLGEDFSSCFLSSVLRHLSTWQSNHCVNGVGQQPHQPYPADIFS